MDSKSHWEEIYHKKLPGEVSWHQENPELSLELIRSACPDRETRIIDVGGGASRIAQLLDKTGYKNISVLDISARALQYAQQEMGPDAIKIDWVVTDILQFEPTQSFDLWHDRAVFHFLTDADDRKKYVHVLKRTLSTQGVVIIATFGVGGPDRCSGLPVVQYDAEKLIRELGAEFKLLRQAHEIHRTPWGTEQKFFFALFQRSAAQ